jgi:murein DD-endopeptidase MepM/ murein hydrolase activator NlpD
MRRLHPVRKTVRPHRGIDYAAPRGTPIFASGDGRIKTASRNRANGRYIIINHGQQFVTKYLHLSKFGRGIKAGKKVKQGQVIGYVGSTGLATGPHLHYEFLVNGTHMNPRTVALPKAQSIAKSELAQFALATRQHTLLLTAFSQQMTNMAAE